MKKNDITKKSFFIIRPEKQSELMKVYRDFIKDKFLVHTFFTGHSDKLIGDCKYTRYDGADDDYRIISDIKKTDSKELTIEDITKVVNEVHEETGIKGHQPVFVLSSPYGGDYDDPFAKTAQKLFTEKNGFDVWNEIWMGQDLVNEDGNKNFNFGETAKRNAGEFHIERATINDAGDFAHVYDRSINGVNSVYASDIDTLNYTKKILSTKAKDVDVVTFLARHNKTGAIAGFLLGGTDGEHAYINDIGTDPEFRQMGVCSLLVQHFNTYAKKLGAKHVFLDTMDGHTVNVPLYTKLGFQKRFLTVQGWHAEPEQAPEPELTR